MAMARWIWRWRRTEHPGRLSSLRLRSFWDRRMAALRLPNSSPWGNKSGLSPTTRTVLTTSVSIFIRPPAGALRRPSSKAILERDLHVPRALRALQQPVRRPDGAVGPVEDRSVRQIDEFHPKIDVV